MGDCQHTGGTGSQLTVSFPSASLINIFLSPYYVLANLLLGQCCGDRFHMPFREPRAWRGTGTTSTNGRIVHRMKCTWRDHSA